MDEASRLRGAFLLLLVARANAPYLSSAETKNLKKISFN